MTDLDRLCMNRRAWYEVMPRADSTPAYKLSQEEARDTIVSYVRSNQLTLEKPVTFGSDGSPSYPRIGERVKLRLGNIGGVRYVPNSSAASAWTMTGPMDLRTAVLAVRLALQLRLYTKWGVSEIYWGGMGVGRDPNDRHGKGLAIDFHGALTRFGAFDVTADWGARPITLPNGKVVRQWPHNVQPRFRLDVATPAGEFFYDVYRFLAGEASDNGTNNASSIGGRSQILCPDTPDAALRATHQDHIHCEVGR